MYYLLVKLEAIEYIFNCTTSFLRLFYKWDGASIVEQQCTMCTEITMRQRNNNFPSLIHSFCERQFLRLVCFLFAFEFRFSNRINVHFFTHKKYNIHLNWATAKKAQNDCMHAVGKVKCRKYHGFWCAQRDFESEHLSSPDVCSLLIHLCLFLFFLF